MDFDLSADERRARDAASTLDLAPRSSPREAARALGDAGLLNTQAPLSLALMLEEVSAKSPDAGVVAWTTSALFIEPLSRFASSIERSERTRAVLAEVTAGRALAAAAIGEDSKTRSVTLTHDGEVLTLRGEKRFVLLGNDADHVLVVANASGGSASGGGVSAVLVDPRAAGVRLAEVTDRSATLVLDGVRVDASQVIGHASGLVEHAERLGAIAVAAHAVGVARGALERATARLRERRSSSTGDLQLATFSLADMATELDAARLLVHRAALGMDSDPRAVAVAKLFATETAVQITLRAARFFGRDAAQASSELETYHQAARFAELDGEPGERLRPRISASLSNHQGKP